MLLNIDEVSKKHDRKQFDCGVEELNQFLQQQARQKTSKHVSKTYVGCWDESPAVVAGYYTLTGYSVSPPPVHKDYHNYPHPLSAVKLARLAVDRDCQGARLGEKLLIDAIRRTVLAAEQISAIGLFVDPMTPDVVPFYEQYGFMVADPAEDDRLELWLPIGTCYDAVKDLV
ncbi:GNAT family N-acetyltransferase [Litoribacillus peritrichatus]|uniref:GNAT family N-acetyltransferase n=1 Tax=Litoribacillus peritrichatus TaxID=718191 RepID=A0ABP7NAY0_9GAMM